MKMSEKRFSLDKIKEVFDESRGCYVFIPQVKAVDSFTCNACGETKPKGSTIVIIYYRDDPGVQGQSCYSCYRQYHLMKHEEYMKLRTATPVTTESARARRPKLITSR